MMWVLWWQDELTAEKLSRKARILYRLFFPNYRKEEWRKEGS